MPCFLYPAAIVNDTTRIIDNIRLSDGNDLRSTFCTLLLKNDFNPKAVSKLMGHSKEIITMDVYGDNKGIIADGIPEMEEFMQELLPDIQTDVTNDQTDVLPDIDRYFRKDD